MERRWAPLLDFYCPRPPKTTPRDPNEQKDSTKKVAQKKKPFSANNDCRFFEKNDEKKTVFFLKLR